MQKNAHTCKHIVLQYVFGGMPMFSVNMCRLQYVHCEILVIDMSYWLSRGVYAMPVAWEATCGPGEVHKTFPALNIFPC